MNRVWRRSLENCGCWAVVAVCQHGSDVHDAGHVLDCMVHAEEAVATIGQLLLLGCTQVACNLPLLLVASCRCGKHTSTRAGC